MGALTFSYCANSGSDFVYDLSEAGYIALPQSDSPPLSAQLQASSAARLFTEGISLTFPRHGCGGQLYPTMVGEPAAQTSPFQPPV